MTPEKHLFKFALHLRDKEYFEMFLCGIIRFTKNNIALRKPQISVFAYKRDTLRNTLFIKTDNLNF